MTSSLAVLCIKTASAFQLRLQIQIEGESNRVSSEKIRKKKLVFRSLTYSDVQLNICKYVCRCMIYVTHTRVV